MLTWARYKATTSMGTKRPKLEKAEPTKAARWDVILLIALQLMTKSPESTVSAISPPEARIVILMTIKRSEILENQLASTAYA